MKKAFIIIFIWIHTLWANDYGALLLNGNCTTCHHIHKNTSAPSLQLIKQRYIEAFPQKKEFVTYMTTWVIKPKKETSLMHDMIEKYGLMPELAYDQNTLETISSYIFTQNLNNISD